MKTYYVNEFYDGSVSNGHCGDMIGLFGECVYEGRGYFCGWYAAEYYLDTELHAHYFADRDYGFHSPEKRITEVTVHNPSIKYNEVLIGGAYWERYIDAETLEEAIEKFKNGEWRNKL